MDPKFICITPYEEIVKGYIHSYFIENLDKKVIDKFCLKCLEIQLVWNHVCTQQWLYQLYYLNKLLLRNGEGNHMDQRFDVWATWSRCVIYNAYSLRKIKVLVAQESHST